MGSIRMQSSMSALRQVARLQQEPFQRSAGVTQPCRLDDALRAEPAMDMNGSCRLREGYNTARCSTCKRGAAAFEHSYTQYYLLALQRAATTRTRMLAVTNILTRTEDVAGGGAHLCPHVNPRGLYIGSCRTTDVRQRFCTAHSMAGGLATGQREHRAQPQRFMLTMSEWLRSGSNICTASWQQSCRFCMFSSLNGHSRAGARTRQMLQIISSSVSSGDDIASGGVIARSESLPPPPELIGASASGSAVSDPDGGFCWV